MDQLFQTKQVRDANRIVMEELRLQNEEFRCNADGVNLAEERLGSLMLEKTECA